MVSLFDFSQIAAIGNSLLYWVGIFFILLITGILLFFFIHVISFKYRTRNAFDLLLDRNGQPYIGKRKYNRFRLNKAKSAWQPLLPLFNKIEFSCFPDNCILPGNEVDAMRKPDGQWIPMHTAIEIKKDAEGKPLSVFREFSPFPNYIKQDFINVLKKVEIEFTKQTEWEKNRPYIIMIATVFCCVVLTGATIYFTFKYANSSFNNLQATGQGIVDQMKQIITSRGA